MQILLEQFMVFVVVVQSETQDLKLDLGTQFTLPLRCSRDLAKETDMAVSLRGQIWSFRQQFVLLYYYYRWVGPASEIANCQLVALLTTSYPVSYIRLDADSLCQQLLVSSMDQKGLIFGYKNSWNVPSVSYKSPYLVRFMHGT